MAEQISGCVVVPSRLNRVGVLACDNTQLPLLTTKSLSATPPAAAMTSPQSKVRSSNSSARDCTEASLRCFLRAGSFCNQAASQPLPQRMHTPS